ncbi:MAG: chalcone isomerase family protein [Gammaproteobacteria bacterium]|nr:chalcone isomerase family protein [Gammaproteobacteria bacterium]
MHSATAVNLANNKLAASIVLNNKQLLLNGAGIRKKYFTDIYIAALYLETPSNNIREILESSSFKRISLYFLYDEVSAEKLKQGWIDGFRQNNSFQSLAAMQPGLTKSINLLQTMHRGDTIYMDYIPGQGTFLSINHQHKGFIKGADFYRGVLKIWLGEQPADQILKDAMLGITSSQM